MHVHYVSWTRHHPTHILGSRRDLLGRTGTVSEDRFFQRGVRGIAIALRQRRERIRRQRPQWAERQDSVPTDSGGTLSDPLG